MAAHLGSVSVQRCSTSRVSSRGWKQRGCITAGHSGVSAPVGWTSLVLHPSHSSALMSPDFFFSFIFSILLSCTTGLGLTEVGKACIISSCLLCRGALLASWRLSSIGLAALPGGKCKQEGADVRAQSAAPSQPVFSINCLPQWKGHVQAEYPSVGLG